VHVIAGPDNQSFVDGVALVRVRFVVVARAGIDVNYDQVFPERRCRRDHLSGCIHRETAAVEYQLIVPANLVHIHNGDVVTLGRARKQVTPELALAHVIRRRVDAQQHLRAGLREFFHGVAKVQTAIPELLVVPSVLADGDCGLASAHRVTIAP
jgi:hypothetical protein